MLAIPTALQSKFAEQLQIRSIPDGLHVPYQKWLRCYLDFCQKQRLPPRQEKSPPPFLNKLREKRQSKTQRDQAAAAIAIYDGILREAGRLGTAPARQTGVPSVGSPPAALTEMSVAEPPAGQMPSKTISSSALDHTAPASMIPSSPGPSNLQKRAPSESATGSDSGSLPPTAETGASWRSEYSRLADEIRVRHYSSKTLKTYRGWSKHFQTFTHSKDPAKLCTVDVKAFLRSPSSSGSC